MKKSPKIKFTDPIAIVQAKRSDKWMSLIWIYPDNIGASVVLSPVLGNVTEIRVVKPKNEKKS